MTTCLKITEINISPLVPLSIINPWTLPDPVVVLILLCRKNIKKEFILYPQVIKTYIENNYSSCVHIYTDASKNGANKIGISFIAPDFAIKNHKQITAGLSVYTGGRLAKLLDCYGLMM